MKKMGRGSSINNTIFDRVKIAVSIIGFILLVVIIVIGLSTILSSRSFQTVSQVPSPSYQELLSSPTPPPSPSSQQPSLVPTNAANQIGTTEGWMTYKDIEHGFVIKYPPQWSSRDESGGIHRFASPDFTLDAVGKTKTGLSTWIIVIKPASGLNKSNSGEHWFFGTDANKYLSVETHKTTSLNDKTVNMTTYTANWETWGPAFGALIETPSYAVRIDCFYETSYESQCKQIRDLMITTFSSS